jgi:hypothetical protein
MGAAIDVKLALSHDHFPKKSWMVGNVKTDPNSPPSPIVA